MFLGICQSGRFQDHADDGSDAYRQFWREVAAADYIIVPGPERRMRWGVADSAVHDDPLMSAGLCAVLDRETAPAANPASLVEAEDVLR